MPAATNTASNTAVNFGVPVPDQESEPMDVLVKVHQQIPDCLRHPFTFVSLAPPGLPARLDRGGA